jgi:hypothetical protein
LRNEQLRECRSELDGLLFIASEHVHRFNDFGDLLGAATRAHNVRGAAKWRMQD